MKSLTLRLLPLLAALLIGPTAGSAAPRTVLPLDEDWRFHLGEAPDAILAGYPDGAWRKVDVPHDYVIEGTFQEKMAFPDAAIGRDAGWHVHHGFLPVQPAVYRKELMIPAAAEGKLLWLEFDGVCSNSRYWLNGRPIGSQYSGYTRSRFDITRIATCGGRNVITVQVDPRFDGWWYEGGGIYRHVRLVIVDPIHIAPDGVFVSSSVSDPGDGVTAAATVMANTDVENAGSAPASALVSTEILNDRGEVVARSESTQELAAGATATIRQNLSLARASLWSVDAPRLYDLRSSIIVAGKPVDRVTTKFGIRQVKFDAERGVLLNGRPLKLKGVNMHQDHAGVGVAVPDRLFTWRLERLKEIGCNAIRMSHNPVSPFLLDECDRMGFVVIAENRHLGDTYTDQSPKDVPATAHTDLSALVTRDRNHPSIILWSMCNEQWIQASPESAAIIRAMKRRVHEIDPTRPVTAAMNGGFDSATGMASELDVIGINYNPWTYDSVHKLFPHTPIIATETASEVGTRGIYADDRWDGYVGDRRRSYLSAYSLSSLAPDQPAEKSWEPVASRSFMGGGFVWAGFDYKGEPRPFEWPVVNSNLGFMDLCGFPKDSYFYYKANWTHEPVLHLFPHWNWQGQEGREISVWVYTNCGRVELFLNGRSLGSREGTPFRHLEWKVKYAPGQLLAKALFKGRPVEAKVETTGTPAALRLSADRTRLVADNVDLSVIKVEVLDAQGRCVPTAGNRISFSVSGPGKLIGVGNGDPNCHEPDKAGSRPAFNGLAQALVQASREPGEIRLRAEAQGLAPAELSITSNK